MIETAVESKKMKLKKKIISHQKSYEKLLSKNIFKNYLLFLLNLKFY